MKYKRLLKERDTQEQYGYIMVQVEKCQMQSQRIGNDKISNV